MINEVSVEEAYEWLKTSIKAYADHHDVIFEDEALKLAVKLSKKHIDKRYLPDKVSCPNVQAEQKTLL